MNKTQSVIFVLAVLAITIIGNAIYLDRPKGATIVKLSLKACSDDDALARYIGSRPMELVYHHDTLVLQYYNGDPKVESSNKTIYYFVKSSK